MAAFTVPVKGGSLTVTVIRATKQDGWADGGGREQWTEAAVHVDGEVKLRGIPYAVAGVAYRWLRHPRRVYVEHKETSETTHWQWDHEETRYDGGYRRLDTGRKVESRTATDKALDALVGEALAAFAEAHPDWQRESFAMRLESKILGEEEEAALLRKRALAHDEAANRLRLELERLGDEG